MDALLFQLGLLAVVLTGVTGFLLVRTGADLLRGGRSARLLERLQWLFPLRGKWLQRGVGLPLVLMGVALMVVTSPVLLISGVVLGTGIVLLSPLAFALAILWMAAQELRERREVAAGAEGGPDLRRARVRQVVLISFRAAAGGGIGIVYGYFLMHLMKDSFR